MPPPIGPSSSTITALPARASKYAVVRPAMPAPTITTLVVVSWLNGLSFGVPAVAAQTDSVVPEVGFIEVSSLSAINIVILTQRLICQPTNRAGCHARL